MMLAQRESDFAVLGFIVYVLLAILCGGAVLAVMGFWNKKRNMWAAGLVMFGFALLVLAAGAAYVGLTVFHERSVGRPPHVYPDPGEGSDVNMRLWFRMATSLILPPETRYLGGYDTRPGGGKAIYLKFSVPPEYRRVLDAEFERATSQELPKEFLPPADAPAALDFRDVTVTGGKACYARRCGDGTLSFATSIAFDEQTGTAWCLIQDLSLETGGP